MRTPHLVGQASRRLFSTSIPRRSSPSDVVELAYTRHDPSTASSSGGTTPIIIMHGLFGSQRNNRTFSKVLAQNLSRPVYNVDLRNHGASPHHPTHTYTAMSADIENFLQTHSLTKRHNIKPILLGHSMGAKVAMTLALRQPTLYSGIVPVDNSPVDAALKSDFGKYLQAMLEIENAGCTKQSDADQILQKHEPELSIRQFLLTNFVKDKESGKMKFRIPLQTLNKSLGSMADFPFKDPDTHRFEGPTLVLRGGASHYVADETLPIMGRFFPRFELVDLKGAGHWVIAERFEECVSAVVEWVQRTVDEDGSERD